MSSTLPFPAWTLFRGEQTAVSWLQQVALRLLQICVAVLSICLLAGNAAADTPAAGSFAGGNGTQADPFQISNLAELRRFMESAPIFPNNSWYKLTANIDASDTSTWFPINQIDHSGWLPVDATLLDGFDPAGFEIQNLFINRPTTDNVGFFSITNSLSLNLNNFKFVGGQITGQDYVGTLIGRGGNAMTIANSQSSATVSGRSNVGGLAGMAGSGTIVSSSATGNVTGSGDIVGGLVGNAAGPSVSSSYATGHVTGKKQVGGLTGVFTQGSGTGLTTSWASGQVDGDDLVGGLVGFSNGKVTFSYATGAVAATGNSSTVVGYAFAGGLIGQQSTARETEDSWASGAVSGPLKGIGGLIGSNAGPILRSATVAGQTVSGGASAGSVGGLVGDNQGSITASRSASTVSASGTGVESIGGLVGINAAGTGITGSYATGAVTAGNANKVGGLVGWHTAGAISGSHAIGSVSGTNNVGGLIGLSTTPAVNTSFATGTVSGATMVGGLIGNRGSGTTDTTFATGGVTATGDYAGGLIGFNTGAVKKSYAKLGNVSGANRVGGLIGYNQGTVEISYALGNVTGTNMVGGLAGQSASTNFGVRDCYAKGTVTGSDKVGGLVGRNESASNINRCYASGTLVYTGAGSIGGLVGDNQGGSNANNYWNTGTTAFAGIGTGFATGATGLTATQMKQQASFTGFIFPSPWLINEGVTEPYFDFATAGGQVGTATGLVSGINPSVSGQTVTFTASIAPNTATGTVLFQIGATPLPGCVAVTVTTGQAQCSISTLEIGTNSVSAVYSGDNGNLASTSSTLNQLVNPPTLDIDASNSQTKYDAATDGVLVVRYLFGVTGNSLATGALGGTATRTDPAQIKSYLDAIRPVLDIDGNGRAEALTDGLLIVRHLLGLTSDALIAGAVDQQSGTRKLATDIHNYLQALMP